MSYPFAGNPYAQSDSHGAGGYPTQQQYSDPYSAQHEYGHNSAYYDDGGDNRAYATAQPAEYGSYDDDHHARLRTNDSDVAHTGGTPRTGFHSTDDELDGPDVPDKMHNEGSTPYYASATRSADDLYARSNGSIWTVDQKRAMQKRRVPARIFRVLACLVINAIIVIISIVCLVVIFVRPFNVGVGNVQAPSTSSVGVSGNALTFNGSVDFIISNPNSIAAGLSLSAKVYDTVDDSQDLGRGEVADKDIKAHANTTVTFPYQVRYDSTKDANKVILLDLAKKCGLGGGSTQDLSLELNIDAEITILSVPIPVSFKHDFNVPCPISTDVLKQFGGNDIQQILGSISKRTPHGATDGLHAEL